MAKDPKGDDSKGKSKDGKKKGGKPKAKTPAVPPKLKRKKKQRRAAAVQAVATRLKASRPKVVKSEDPEAQLSVLPLEGLDRLDVADKEGPPGAHPAADLAKPPGHEAAKPGAKAPAGGQPADPKSARKADASPKPAAEQKPGSGTVDPEAIAQALQVGPDFVLADVDTSATPGFTGDKAAAAAAMAATSDELADLQERLYAHGKTGGSRSLLLLVQGMDTAGKGGIMRHVVGSMDPQGIRLTAFKAPTAEEKKKGYLWRIREALPAAGQVGVFDRSQYEDVLPVRVLNLAPRSVWSRRYSGINTFEAQQVNRGMTIVKVMLHISKDEQGERLAERIERPDKHWKHNPGDIDNRRLWDDYQAAYQDLLTKCSTPNAPWYVVPADKKWYARFAVQQLVLKALRDMQLDWPEVDFDVAAERQRLAES